MTLGCALLMLSLAHTVALASIPPGFATSSAGLRLSPKGFPESGYPLPIHSIRNPKPALSPTEGSEIRNLFPLTVTLRLTPSPVQQGQTLIVFVRTNTDVAVSGRLFDQSLVFASSGRNHWALMGVPPWGNIGLHRLVVTAEDVSGRQVTRMALVQVVGGDFPQEEVSLLPGREQLLDPATVAKEWETLKPIFQEVTPLPLWSGPFRLPVRSVVTSQFGVRRSYGGGPPRGYHTGLDLRGTEGTPVAAAEWGRVVLAQELTVRGKAVILDHGLGVHTGYYHLSSIAVRAGEWVYKGQIIGRVGRTGLVSGPHLHWELRIREVPVDPLIWTAMAIPEPGSPRPQLLPDDEEYTFNNFNCAHAHRGCL